MADLHAQDIADMVVGVLRHLGPNKFSQIAQSLTDYEVMPKWFKKDRVTFGSGRGIRRTLLTSTLGSAEHVGLFHTSNTNVGDHLVTMQADWTHAQTKWAFERRETLMGRGAYLVNDVIKPRRFAAMLDMVELIETAAWTAPAADDYSVPFGVPYWAVKNATTGFNGGVSGSWTTSANVDVDAVPTFKNYSGTYETVTKDDLISWMRTAKRKIGFKSPVDIPEYRGKKGSKYRIYCNETTIKALEDLGEQQNENLGRDLAPMDGTMTFRGHPIIYVPYLDNDTEYPVYMLDHDVFKPYILKGDYLREAKPQNSQSQPNTFVTYVDLSYQYLCIDRRRLAVAYIA